MLERREADSQDIRAAQPHALCIALGHVRVRRHEYHVGIMRLQRGMLSGFHNGALFRGRVHTVAAGYSAAVVTAIVGAIVAAIGTAE